MPVISILNQKGGVGKTTLTVNLAHALRRGIKPRSSVRAINLDAGSLTLDGYEGRVRGVEIIPLDEAAHAEIDGYDYTLLDCPAAVNEHVTKALQYTDIILIAVFPDRSAFEALERVLGWVERNKTRDIIVRGVLMNYSRAYPDDRKIKKEFLDEMSEIACKTIIPRAAAIQQANNKAKSIFDVAPDSQAARAYENLAREVTSWL